MTQTHIIQRGETPRTIAKQYTGDGSRAHELVDANPRIPAGYDSSGNKTIPAEACKPGRSIDLPATWTGGNDGSMGEGLFQGPARVVQPVLTGRMGPGGGSCCPATVVRFPPHRARRYINRERTDALGLGAADDTAWWVEDADETKNQSGNSGACYPQQIAIKPYFYVLQPGDEGSIGLVATKFGQPNTQHTALMAANADMGTFIWYNKVCSPTGWWKAGKKVQIPAHWEEKRFTDAVKGHLVDAAGNKVDPDKIGPGGTSLSKSGSSGPLMLVLAGMGVAILGVLAAGKIARDREKTKQQIKRNPARYPTMGARKRRCA